MTISYLKALRRKEYFLILVLLFSLLLTSSTNNTWRFLKKRTSVNDSNSYPVFIPGNQPKDPIDLFKSGLLPFKHIKNPCWHDTPFIPPNMIEKMELIWRRQVFSKEIPTENLIEVMVEIRREWYRQKQSKFRCFPYFYIMSSSNCIRNEIVNLLIQHPKIKAPKKIDIDFWPNVLSDNIRSYADHFDIPASLIAQDKFMITFDASSSTLFKTNPLLHLNGLQYSTADFIHAFNKDVKIFVLLQDPVSKVYADYLTEENESSPDQFHEKVIQSIEMFEKCLQASELLECINSKNLTRTYPISLHLGIYWVFLERWLHNFSPREIKLFCIEDYLKCKDCLMDQIFNFLLLRKGDSSVMDINYNCLNPKLPMLNKTKRILKEFYSPYNKKLAEVSGNKGYMWY